MRYVYPVVVEIAADGVTVTFPDVPEAITCADTEAEALTRAAEALVTALSFYVEDNRALPAASPADGRPVVAVPALEAVKLALSDSMVAAGMSNAELARRLGCDEKAVRRLRDVLHGSKIGQLEAALRSLGKRIEVSVMEAA
jgi:antitoxin HicB